MQIPRLWTITRKGVIVLRSELQEEKGMLC